MGALILFVQVQPRQDARTRLVERALGRPGACSSAPKLHRKSANPPLGLPGLIQLAEHLCAAWPEESARARPSSAQSASEWQGSIGEIQIDRSIDLWLA